MGWATDFIKGIGNTAGNALTGGIIGNIFGGMNDKRQREQQQHLTDMQLKAQQQLNKSNNDLQLDMWKKTNFPAQMAMLKEAGLSPGLIYGGSGAGGATTGSAGGSVSGGSASGHSGEAMGIAALAQQQQMNQAQLELIKAQTNKTNVEADKTAGVDTTMAKVQIDIAKIERDVRDQTSEAAIGIINKENHKAVEELQIARNQSKISDETYKQEIERVGAELAGTYLRNKQVKAQTKLTEAQEKEVIQSIQTQIKQLQQGDEHIKIQQIRNELIKTGIWVGAGTQIVGNLVSILNKPGQIAETITETFDDGHGQRTQSTRHKR